MLLSRLKNTFSCLVLFFLMTQSYVSFAQDNDVVFTATGILYISMIENDEVYRFSSTELFTAVNPKLKKLEMKVPFISIASTDSSSTSAESFFSAFQIDTLYEGFLKIYVDFPNDEIRLTDFANKEDAFVGKVDFGKFEVKGEVTVNGIYNVEYLLFDFDCLLNGPFQPVIKINDREVTEVHIFAKGLKVYNR